MPERAVVFCSHASADKPAVSAFAERLRADGFDAWVDRWEMGAGDDLVAQINGGLERCAAGLIFFSRATPGSVWVGAEVSALIYRAIQGLRVIPIMIDDDAPVPPLLAPYLRRRIDEYEAVRNALLGANERPALGALPERLLRELLIRLTPEGKDRVGVQVWQGGVRVADERVRRSAILNGSYDHIAFRGAPSETILSAVGEACGKLLFPPLAARRLSEMLPERRPGDRVDIVIEANTGGPSDGRRCNPRW